MYNCMGEAIAQENERSKLPVAGFQRKKREFLQEKSFIVGYSLGMVKIKAFDIRTRLLKNNLVSWFLTGTTL